MARLAPGASASHEEKWSLARKIDVSGDDAAVAAALSAHLQSVGIK